MYICIFNSHKNTSHETPGAAFFYISMKARVYLKSFQVIYEVQKSVFNTSVSGYLTDYIKSQ